MNVIRMYTGAFAGALMLFSGFVFSSTVSVELVGVSDGVPYEGIYAGFYELDIDGTTILAMCDDVSTWISIGDTWSGVTYTYSDVIAGADVKFNGLAQATLYSQAGWLFSQADSAVPVERARIQAAVWNIMTPGGIAMDIIAQSYYDDAIDGSHDVFDWSGTMEVLTPNPKDASQEFLMSTVPLPPSFLLFVSGFVGVIVVARPRKE